MAAGTLWRPRLNTALLFTSFFFFASATASITSQFQHFYPQHAREYEYILQHNCTRQFDNYRTGRPQDFEIDALDGGGPATVLVEPVIECLLENVSEYIKAASASAQVVLGLTPPILASLGASADELATLSYVGRRPLLSLLLSIGSPSVFSARAFVFDLPKELLRYTEAQCRPYRPRENSHIAKGVLVAMQYVIALAAATNIATLSWELGIRTVCSWWPNTVFAILAWSALRIAIHFGGILALRLRVRRRGKSEGLLDVLKSGWRDITKFEWQSAVCEDDKTKFEMEDHEERSLVTVAWLWFLSAGTIIHMVFGSLVFSSLLFIGPSDALIVIVRYVASVVACRIIVVFEFAGMREQEPPGSKSGGGQTAIYVC
ncbi:hypothetical protein F4861DRAFT_157996 [Xylaria intraflava]|nr:hypothetical protein F4861DRAFT_157996 [Xylaria intraflava]